MMDEEICRELLELVLGFRIAKVMVSKEKCFVYHPEYKGVRLDILTADGRKYRYTFDMACREDSFVKRVQTAVRNVKASREMEEQYMLLEELIKEAVSEENDPEVLKLYLRQAAAAKSMDDFRQFLDGRKK